MWILRRRKTEPAVAQYSLLTASVIAFRRAPSEKNLISIPGKIQDECLRRAGIGTSAAMRHESRARRDWV